MAEQLITAGEAAQILGVSTDIPANKCITKAEFDLLTAVTLTVVPTPSDATVKLNGTVATCVGLLLKAIQELDGRVTKLEN